MNHLAKRGEKDCAAYLKPGADWVSSFLHVCISCGCKGDMAASTLACRDFNLVLVSNPIAWSYHLTCKQTAAASCKTSVDEFANLWIKVRKDEDKFCVDLYKGTQIMANSCN